MKTMKTIKRKMEKIISNSIIMIFLFMTISISFSQNSNALETTIIDEIKISGFEYPKVSMEVYSPDSIKDELESLIKQIRETHPNLFMIVDYDELLRVKNEILEQITAPMNQLDVFRLFSLLNPVLSDGHNGMWLPERRKQIENAIKLGDRLFPIPVYIDKDFHLLVKTTTNGITSGTRIHSINGIDAIEITKHMEGHTRGDNSDIRRNLVANTFAENLWQFYGSSKSFVLGINEGKEIKETTINGSIDLLSKRSGNKSFEDKFSFELLANNQVGYFKANTFYLPEGTEKLNALTDSLFSVLRDKGSKYLIIDIRENGGGFDELWIDGIISYTAKKKVQRMSHYIGRVRETDEVFPGRVGEVAIYDFKGEIEVSEKPKFEGEIYLIVGRKTYSSAIMFASVIKDNQLGKIVGQEARTLGRGCSTGRFVFHEMKTTGLIAFTPEHWYQRNIEGSCMEGVKVDIQLSDSPYNKREIIDSLVRQLTN